tara:strand:- start:105 stop:449 length:345 start_codon:yes stop_codon:yes gene_type:complete
MPDIPEPEPLEPMEPLPLQQQPAVAPLVEPVTPTQAQPVAPAVQPVSMSQNQVPPPVAVDGQSTDQPIVKKRKSKRRELQQASKGASALRIPLSKKLGSTPSGGTGSTGLNIPT